MFIMTVLKYIIGCGVLAYISDEFYTAWNSTDIKDIEL